MSPIASEPTLTPSFPTIKTTTDDAQDRRCLQAALAQISRLEREFQDFRKHAGAQLASALEENRHLRHRLQQLQQLQQQAHKGDSPAAAKMTNTVTEKENENPNTANRSGRIKPSERMLSVEEMRKREVTRKSVVRRSLRPVRGFTPQNQRKGGGGRDSRGFDGERKETDGLGAGTGQVKGNNGGGGSISVGTSSGGGRRNSLLPRSFSRKWSGCF